MMDQSNDTKQNIIDIQPAGVSRLAGGLLEVDIFSPAYDDESDVQPVLAEPAEPPPDEENQAEEPDDFSRLMALDYAPRFSPIYYAKKAFQQTMNSARPAVRPVDKRLKRPPSRPKQPIRLGLTDQADRSGTTRAVLTLAATPRTLRPPKPSAARAAGRKALPSLQPAVRSTSQPAKKVSARSGQSRFERADMTIHQADRFESDRFCLALEMSERPARAKADRMSIGPLR